MSCISDSELLNFVTVSSLRMSVRRIPEASVGQSRFLKGCSRPQPCPTAHPSGACLYVSTAVVRLCTQEPLGEALGGHCSRCNKMNLLPAPSYSSSWSSDSHRPSKGQPRACWVSPVPTDQRDLLSHAWGLRQERVPDSFLQEARSHTTLCQ